MAKPQKGAPPARIIETAYLAGITEVVTPERWAKIVEKAASDAEAGNEKARAWLASYLMGKAGADAPKLSNCEGVEHRVAKDRLFRF